VVLSNRRALRHVLWQPNEPGLARAYVTGDLDVDGDLKDELRRAWAAVRDRALTLPGLRPGMRLLDVGRGLGLARCALRTEIRGGGPGEHVGEENYPAYAKVLRRNLRPGGRLVLQQMSRGGGPAAGVAVDIPAIRARGDIFRASVATVGRCCNGRGPGSDAVSHSPVGG
jgi:hypothetical protein